VKKSIILSFVILFSSHAISGISSTQFYGYYQTQAIIKQRVYTEDSQFTIGDYLGSKDLGLLLGASSGDGLDSGFRNGLPNATNMSLWRVAMTGLANDWSNVCVDSYVKQNELNTEAIAIFKAICDWPSSTARNKEGLERLWLLIMGYQAPHEEFEIWSDYFMQDKFKKLSGQEAVDQLSYSILLNPYFLLRN
jgi:hypothetical protein